jgi:hypothetical protein
MWKQSPIDWRVRHVECHQDDFKTQDDIDRWRRVNIEMDALTKSHINYTKTCLRHFALFHEPWTLWMNGDKVKKKLTRPYTS